MAGLTFLESVIKEAAPVIIRTFHKETLIFMREMMINLILIFYVKGMMINPNGAHLEKASLQS